MFGLFSPLFLVILNVCVYVMVVAGSPHYFLCSVSRCFTTLNDLKVTSLLLLSQWLHGGNTSGLTHLILQHTLPANHEYNCLRFWGLHWLREIFLAPYSKQNLLLHERTFRCFDRVVFLKICYRKHDACDDALCLSFLASRCHILLHCPQAVSSYTVSTTTIT